MMRQVLQRCSAGPVVLRLPYVSSRALSGPPVTGLRLARDSSSFDLTRRHDAIVFRDSESGAQPFLSTRGFGDVASRSDVDAKPRAVLVQVGGGQFSLVKLELMEMDRMSLLEALAASRGFMRSLDVALDKCVVTVDTCMSDEGPTTDEVRSAKELKGAKKLRELASGMAAATAGTNLFVRVTLPGVSTTTTADAAAVPVLPRASLASMPFNADLLIPEDVWGGMGPLAQATAAAAGTQRAMLARSLPLLELGEALPAAEASRLGVSVLHTVGSDVSLGLFTLPKLDRAVQIPPKTYEEATSRSHQLLLLPQRLELAGEFVKAVASGTDGSGVLLSGPNGVGKSGVGFLSYLLCVARRLPVVYLSRTETWREAAQSGEGHAFLLSAFWEQNADLIAASEPLRAVFAAALRDEAGALTSHVMDALRRTARRHRLGIGVVLDEVQHITAAVQRGDKSDSSTPAFAAGSYFRNNWHDWMNDNSAFVRMSIASAHGERDFKLPSGEDHRLRIVEPLTDSQREALQSHPDSPAFISDPDARKRIVFYSGNVLRALMNAGRALPANSPTALDTELSRRLGKMHVAMQEDCRLWLASLPKDERATAAGTSMDLLSGKMRWTAAKGLYDAGIMFRSASSDFIHPVSAWASSAYLTCTAQYIRGAAKPLSSFTDGRIRGFELEKQLLACLVHADAWVGTKLLDGHESVALHLRSSYALPFKVLDEVVPRESPVLYRPLSLRFPCDGILMPAADDAEGVIIVLESSTMDPRNKKRVSKVLRYLEPEGVVSALARSFPALPRIVALVFDEDLPKGEPSSVEAVALSRGEHPTAAATSTLSHVTLELASVAQVAALDGERRCVRPKAAEVRVLDRNSLVTLGGMML